VTGLKFCRLSWCSASRGFVSDSWATCSVAGCLNLLYTKNTAKGANLLHSLDVQTAKKASASGGASPLHFGTISVSRSSPWPIGHEYLSKSLALALEAQSLLTSLGQCPPTLPGLPGWTAMCHYFMTNKQTTTHNPSLRSIEYVTPEDGNSFYCCFDFWEMSDV